MRTGMCISSTALIFIVNVFQSAHGQVTAEKVSGPQFFSGFFVRRLNCLSLSRLDDRWGIETSAKGTRFKLNRDLAGYHLTARAEVGTIDQEARIKLVIPDPEKLRTTGSLVHFDAVSFGWKGKMLLEDVTFTVAQGGRCAFVGAVECPPAATIVYDT